MYNICQYIQEKLVLNKNTKANAFLYHPKDKKALRGILARKIDQNKDANLNNIDISLIDDFSNLFNGLHPYNIDVSKWNVSHVKNMRGMFQSCYHFNCDLSNWDVSNVENMSYMFNGCYNFTGDKLDNWNIKQDCKTQNMFDNCNKLQNKPDWYHK